MGKENLFCTDRYLYVPLRSCPISAPLESLGASALWLTLFSFRPPVASSALARGKGIRVKMPRDLARECGFVTVGHPTVPARNCPKVGAVALGAVAPGPATGERAGAARLQQR